MIHIRRPGRLDAGPVAELINLIIAQGGTTAMTKALTRDDIIDGLAEYPGRSAWHLAEDEEGLVLGIQWIEPHDDLPPDAADIATFTQPGHTQMGIGSLLFQQTCHAAKQMGYTWINATIRADNAGGLAYYQSRGFEDYKTTRNVPLADGTVVNKISKRFDL